jgi:hypothetical protein
MPSATDLTAAAVVVDLSRAVVDAGARHLATTGDVDVDQVVAYDLAHAAAGVETARATLEYVRARWAHDRSGRPAVVTDDDVRSLAIRAEASVSRSSVDALRTRPRRQSLAPQRRRLLPWVRSTPGPDAPGGVAG